MRILRKLLPYLGFLCLFVGGYGMGGILPAPLEIGASVVAVLSFAGVFSLYLRSKEKTSRVPRKTFWTMMGALFAVSLLVGLIILQPLGSADKHPEIIGLLMVGFMLPVGVAVIVAGVAQVIAPLTANEVAKGLIVNVAL